MSYRTHETAGPSDLPELLNGLPDTELVVAVTTYPFGYLVVTMGLDLHPPVVEEEADPLAPSIERLDETELGAGQRAAGRSARAQAVPRAAPPLERMERDVMTPDGTWWRLRGFTLDTPARSSQADL